MELLDSDKDTKYIFDSNNNKQILFLESNKKYKILDLWDTVTNPQKIEMCPAVNRLKFDEILKKQKS